MALHHQERKLHKERAYLILALKLVVSVILILHVENLSTEPPPSSDSCEADTSCTADVTVGAASKCQAGSKVKVAILQYISYWGYPSRGGSRKKGRGGGGLI